MHFRAAPSCSLAATAKTAFAEILPLNERATLRARCNAAANELWPRWFPTCDRALHQTRNVKPVSGPAAESDRAIQEVLGSKQFLSETVNAEVRDIATARGATLLWKLPRCQLLVVSKELTPDEEAQCHWAATCLSVGAELFRAKAHVQASLLATRARKVLSAAAAASAAASAILTPNEVNSAFAYRGDTRAIYVFRLEECGKTLLHELLHATKRELWEGLPYCGDWQRYVAAHFRLCTKQPQQLLFPEAYAEMSATLLHACCCCAYNGGDKAQFAAAIEQETMFCLLQCAKILDWAGFRTFSQFFCRSGGANATWQDGGLQLHESTSAFCYYFVRSAVLWQVHRASPLILLISNQEVHSDPARALSAFLQLAKISWEQNELYSRCMNRALKWIRAANAKTPPPTDVLFRTMRMTISETHRATERRRSPAQKKNDRRTKKKKIERRSARGQSSVPAFAVTRRAQETSAYGERTMAM